MKRLFILALLLTVPCMAHAAAPSRVNNFTSGTTIRASEVNTDFNDLFGYLQTGIDSVRSSGIDAIGEFSSGIRSGSDSTLITGTKGATGLLGYFNADGDLVADTDLIFTPSTTKLSLQNGRFTTGTLYINNLDCTGNANGGALTVAADGTVSCSDDDSSAGSGSGSVTTVKEAGVQVGGADIVTIDFGAGFDVAETPDTEVNITLDFTEDQIDLTAEVTGTLPVGNGGTGAATLTDGGILLGSGSGAVTALGVATNGQIPIGDGTTDPQLGTITGTASEITVTNGAGSITLSLPDPIVTGVTGNVTGDLTGNASTATALAANGANCNAGEYALGVDASGAVESCTDATTEINTEIGNVLDGTDAFTDFNGTDIIDSDNYNGGSIDAEHLAADIIDETKIADDGVDSEHYNADSIDNEHINWADIDNLGDEGLPSELSCTDCINATEIEDIYLLNDGDTGTGVYDFGGATNFEIPNGTSASLENIATGSVAVDTTDDQFIWTGADVRVMNYAETRCALVENLAAADDNFFMGAWADAVTVVDVWCTWTGTGTTIAEISLEDGAGNAMTHTTPVCSSRGQVTPTQQSVTASGSLTARESLLFDVDNAVSPETDEYEICVTYTFDQQ